jgi:lipid-A-disaccharide synthase
MSPPPRAILVSAGEASGEYYAAELVAQLKQQWPECDFFGCAGPPLRKAGVRAIVRTEDLAVVGLVEVVHHLPRIYQRFRTLIAAARAEKPALAILTDSPDFHFRVAAKLQKQGVPVLWLVAPQVWAWRKGRVKTMRRVIDSLLCIFPFEEAFFRQHKVAAKFIGHPLASRVRPSMTRAEFFRKHNLPGDRPLIVMLPGSRPSEALRHIPELRRAAEILLRDRTGDRAPSFVVPASPTCGVKLFEGVLQGTAIRAIEGDAWDAMAHCDVALAASGTVTVEAALLGAPMVTFYRVTPLSWAIGKVLVDVPFYSMVNLIAERRIVPELMQDEMTGERLAAEAARLLDSAGDRAKMKEDLRAVAEKLASEGDPIALAAKEVVRLLEVRN